MRATWRLLTRAPLTWGALALLAVISLGNLRPTPDLGTWVGEYASQLGWLGLWGALLAGVLVSRDRSPGLGDVIGAAPLSRWRYVAGQALGLLALVLLVSAGVGAWLWLTHPPVQPQAVLPRQLAVLWPSLAGIALVTALGLLVGHLVRGPLAFVLPLVAVFVVATAAQFLPHTLSLIPQVKCSELLGCPDLPYGVQAVWLLGLTGLLWLGAVAASRWLALHDPDARRMHTSVLAGGLVAVLALSLPVLSRAAQVYPAPDWRAAPSWPKVDHARPNRAAAAVPPQAYVCTASGPQVCFPQAHRALAERAQTVLRQLPAQARPRSVRAYPDVEFGFTSRQRLIGDTLYVSEESIRQAEQQMSSTVTQSDGQRQALRRDNVPNFLYGLALHALSGTPALDLGSERMPDGSIVTRSEGVRGTLSAERLIQHYHAWLALRADPGWPDIRAALRPLGKDQLLSPVTAEPELRLLFAQGERVGHERLLRALQTQVGVAWQKAPAWKAVQWARGLK